MAAIFGMFQKIGIDPFFKGFSVNIFAGRMFSFLGNPGYVGQYLSPIIPLTIVYVINSKRIILKIFYIFATIIIITALAFSQSRAPLVGLFLSGILLLIWLMKNKYFNTKKIIISILIVTVGAGLVYSLSPERFNFSEKNLRSMQTRFITWEVAYRSILQNPFFGTGMDTYPVDFPRYVKKDFYYFEEDLNTSADRAHNEILETGVWGGIPAIVLYLALNVYLLWLYFSNNERNYQAIALFLGYFCITFQNQFSFSGPAHFGLSMVFLGGIIALTQKHRQIREIKTGRKISIIVIALILIFAGFLGYKTILSPLKSELHYTSYIRTGDPEELNMAIEESYKDMDKSILSF